MVSNKLQDFLPKLSDKLLTPCKTRKEDSSKQTTYWSFLFHAFLSIEKRKASCLQRVVQLSQVEVRKKYFEERSLYLLFQNVNPEKIVDYLKEIGMF